MGWAYKRLVHDRLTMPLALLGWAGLVMAYYFWFAVPGFVIGQTLFYADAFAEFYGAGTSLWEAYRILGMGALPEAVLTAAVTALALLALPRKYRRPLW
jgi:hypothetical protein